jgi:pyruvate dehydrogenase E2 component (dihydrolipoamide acetyltransferase)/2-oxoisovalerate dehydrogenase E2 component (dihydrolipoyl transacylase)
MDFPLPQLGEGLYEVELVRWLVRPGESVARGHGLMEVLSDKATMEVPAPFAGTISSLSATPGAKVQVGQVVLTYTPIGEPVAVGSTPSATFAEKEGNGRSLPSRPTPPEPKGEETALASTSSQPAREATPTNGQPAQVASLASLKLPPAAPSVRMLARKLGVDLARIRGSGPHGRILLDDLSPFLAARSGNGNTAAPSTRLADSPKLDFGIAGTRVPLVGLRRKIAEHMVEAKRQIPHYSYIDECDFTDLVRVRHQLRDPLARTGVKLTYLAFVVKAVARALKAVPIVNSTFDPSAGEVILLDRYHVGIAVATPTGLIVPVIRNADQKDLAAVATEIERLSGAARSGQIRREDLKGGTFTVTSVGGIGGLISTPIINYPEVGIMGVGKVVKRPVYDDHGNVRPADMVYLSFSFDHRIVDGAVGAAFGNAVIKHLQTPASLLLPETFGG